MFRKVSPTAMHGKNQPELNSAQNICIGSGFGWFSGNIDQY
jgi:hypothetical protein